MNTFRNVTLCSLVAILEKHITYLFRVDELPIQSAAQEIIPNYMLWHPQRQ